LFRSTLLIAQFEWARFFGTVRGLVSVLAFALVWLVLLRFVVFPLADFADDLTLAEARFISGLSGALGAQDLLAWPVPEFSVFWGLSPYLFALFSLQQTADQFAGDRARGTLRFVVLHVTRSAIFWGRFWGQMSIQAGSILAVILCVFVRVVAHDTALAVDALPLAMFVFVNLLIVVLPFVALMSLFSALAGSARQATLLAIVFWIVLMLVGVALRQPLAASSLLQWVVPGAQIFALIQTQGWDAVALAPIPLLQTLVLLALAHWVFARRGW